MLSLHVFEQQPRFKDCPPICVVANLPSFRTESEADKYHGKYGASNTVVTMWKCDACHNFHYETDRVK